MSKSILSLQQLNKLLKIVFKKLHIWVDNYFYHPNFLQKIISAIFLPISLIYALIVIFKKKHSKKESLNIKIISIGNLTVGGSSKTPITKAIYEHYKKDFNIFIILRGYKRKSRGLIEVCIDGVLKNTLENCGDEAYLHSTYAKNVIVCEDRKKAILKAKELGSNLILLDDGFSKFKIDKFDILIKPDPAPFFNFTLPSSAYRYPKFFYKFANLIIDQKDIIFKQNIKNPTSRMLLVSAIAKPFRLSNLFDKVIAHEFFPDHYNFKKEELEKLIKKYSATSLLITTKDLVKIKDFNLNLSIIELDLILDEKIFKNIDNYVYNI